MNKYREKSYTQQPFDEPDEAVAEYEKFSAEPLVQACGGVDRASFCCGYDVAKEKYAALLAQAKQENANLRESQEALKSEEALPPSVDIGVLEDFGL